MSRDKLIELARTHLHHAVNGTVPLAETVVEIPVQNYFNEDRWKAEMELIFGRVPLVLGFSTELQKPGDYKAMEVCGVPLILVRNRDGNVGGFVNMCSHRGAQILDEGKGLSLIHI